MADLEGRAADLLDRLTDCGLANGVEQDDLYGSDVRPQFCTMCAALADAVDAVISTAPPFNQKQFADAVQGVRHAAASAGTSGQGKLDKALKMLLLSLDAALSNDRTAVLEYLVAHVQAGRILMTQQDADPQGDTHMAPASPPHQNGGGTSPMKGVDGAEASASALIHDLASLLQCDPSPAQALPVLKAVSGAIDQLLPRLPPSFLEPILPPNSLNNHQMSELEEIDSALREEYTVRRRMLIERAKVTLQSFLWAERLQKEAGKRQPAEAAAQQGEALMHDQPAVSLHDVFKAKQGDIVPIASKATSGDKGKFEASVKGFIIGAVPDRGGRPTEGRAAQAAANMPTWKPRSAADHGGGGRQGGRGGGGAGGGGRHNNCGGHHGHKGAGHDGRDGGGRVQGSWQGSQDGEHHDQPHGGKRGRRGGWGRGRGR
ncbi:hypothetical protein WJX82_001552 [Trebouxia sp. C0006]